MLAVYDKMDEKPDFHTAGDLSLKLWLGDSLVKLPKELDLPIIKPLAPYDEQLGVVNKQIGAQPLRQNMSDKSGASRMAPQTQVSQLHQRSILDLSKLTLEENIYFSLAKIMPEKGDLGAINLLLNLLMKLDEDEMTVVRRARKNGATPNAYLASAVAAIGDCHLVAAAREHTAFVIDTIREFGIDDQMKEFPKKLDDHIAQNMFVDKNGDEDEVVAFLLKEVKRHQKDCLALRVCQHIIKLAEANKKDVRNMRAFLIASLTLCLFWKPMLRKRITRQVVEDAVNYFTVIAKLFGYSVVDPEGNKYWQKLVGEKLSNMTASFTENAFRILFNQKPTESELVEFKYLMGLTLTNGPGTISAKGAKESVSARNHISMAYVGFLANTGRAHGGNGFEAVEYLLKNFKDQKLSDPGSANHGIDVQALVVQAVKEYAEYKQHAKSMGELRAKPIPCINHPVFKGAAVNIDPREDFIRKQFEEKGIHNVFLEFYHGLVQELFTEGVTRNVFCVNIDAVLAVISLKLAWGGLHDGRLTHRQIQDLVFTLFLFGRTIGVTAEIADHRDRGMDMDCRTPQSKLSFVL